MSIDLAERAEARAGFAALAGALVLGEPGPGLAELVAGWPSLAVFADTATAVDFERVFLRTVQPYESVFRSDDARRGGAVAARVADAYAEIEFTEHSDGRWRVAGPDHLGLQLRAHAHLASREAAAWRSERPDEAAQWVEMQRSFFAEHLVTWSEVALDALADVAVGTPYAALIAEIRTFIVAEVDLLRPAPLLDTQVDPGFDAANTDGAAPAMGPSRLARLMLSVARSGVWLSTEHIAEAAHRLGFPWRPMDGRSNLPPLVSAAAEAGELDSLLSPWIALARATAERHEKRGDAQPGAEMVWRDYARRARRTALILDAARSGSGNAVDAEMTIRIAGADLSAAIDSLQAAGYDVEIIGE